ncbi:MAG TPA: AAA family ATPase [Thermoanaerobaculia bacterium]|nr:AAA family ATPase [Thermoanaerobaculia bacterium]
MYRLDRIHVAGYKSIRDQTLDLGLLNVLIGANGAGKSNLMGVFRLLNEIAEKNLQVFVAQAGGADRLLHFGRKVTEEIAIDLKFDRGSYSCSLVPTENDRLIFQSENAYLPVANNSFSFSTGQSESKLLDLTRTPADVPLLTLQQWKVHHFQDTSVSAKVKQTGDLADNAYLRPDAGNLAAFLYRLQETQPSAFRTIEDTVRMVAPFFRRFDLRPDRLNPSKIRLEWQEKDSDTYFHAHDLSDGTLRFISLATLLLQPELPPTVLIDEPELGLHPYAITVLASLLHAAASRTQLVVSTQSVTLVNQLSPEEIIIVDRQDGESVFRRLTEEEIAGWIDDYSLGELWEKNVLGGRPHS